MPPLESIDVIENLDEFKLLLTQNPGLIIIKFSATWCGPCKKIADAFESGLRQMPENVQPVILDIDECFEMYAFMKNKKMVTGIPSILCYYKNSTDFVRFVPNDSCMGSDIAQLNLFFERCFLFAKSLAGV